jgi:hypothetical protein
MHLESEIVPVVVVVALAGEVAGFKRRPLQLCLMLLLIGTIAWRELSPFEFSSTASRFSWIPFTGVFESSRGSGGVVFLDKVFLYGAAVWFVSEVATSMIAAGLLIAGMLFALELVQTHVPGRTPEITDSVLAALLAIIFYVLTDEETRNFSKVR